MDSLKLFSGGFPLTIETLVFMQQSYKRTFGALASMAGDNSILNGIINTAGTYSEGYFTRAGEVVFFNSCVVGTDVRIIDKTVQVPYNQDLNNDGNLDLKDAYVTRYATTDDAYVLGADEVLVETFAFTDLARIGSFRALTPIGSAILWFDPLNIPLGYAICDGTNGTPDLRDKFIKAAGAENIANSTGGARTKTLTAANLPPHAHTIPSHSHNIVGTASDNGEIGGTHVQIGNFEAAGTITTSASAASNTGNGTGLTSTPLNVEPSYYTAIWIQQKGF